MKKLMVTNDRYKILKKTLKLILRPKLTYKLQKYIYQNKLNNLAYLYATDKLGRHNYTPIYSQHFHQLRKNKMNILEIGIGGYDDPTRGGASLRMWKNYFINSHIFGIDIYDKSSHVESRINILQGDQSDPKFLEKVMSKMGYVDIIIDDGSHISEHVISSFRYLFPKLKSGGIYVVEDTQTSYWDDMGGDSKDLSNPKTTMNFFKKIIDAVNYSEFDNDIFDEVEIVSSIFSIHFYHNLIFIYKK